MFHTALKMLLFTVVCLLAVELSYRVVLFGFGAFSPAYMNSMTNIWQSGLVKPSQNPDVYYELKPNLDTTFSGVPFRTNSRGLADKEYSEAKPDDVFRVAVIGSSWTMPTGVAQEHAWHSIIEESLNTDGGDQRYELINFGVEMYGLGELIGTLNSRVAAWQPDLVIVAITTYTAYIKRLKNGAKFEVPARRKPFFESFALQWLNARIGTNIAAKTTIVRPTWESDMGAYQKQLGDSIAEMHTIAQAKGTDLCLVWLGFQPFKSGISQELGAAADRLNIPVIIGNETIKADKPANWREGFKNPRFQVSEDNMHPNRDAHRLIAAEVEKGLHKFCMAPRTP